MASSSSATEAVPPWLELPREITAAILKKLGPIEILMTADNVCTAWRSVCRDPSMWQSIDMRFVDMRFNMEKLCRNAVDHSQGQLIDVNIEYFGSDYVLLYLAQKSRGLRRLQLVHTYNISTEAMIEAVKYFQKLEEMHLYNTYIGAEAVEAIGRCCPLLKSFKLNNRSYRKPPVVYDEEAQAIAKNMPGLRHLQLFGNRMGNEGLQAIIDGCPHLESLDLRQCFNVRLEGDMGKLCSQRIKDLRRPRDPTDDYRFDTEIYDHESEDDDYICARQAMITGSGSEALYFYGGEEDMITDSLYDDFMNCYYNGGIPAFERRSDDDDDDDDDDMDDDDDDINDDDEDDDDDDAS